MTDAWEGKPVRARQSGCGIAGYRPIGRLSTALCCAAASKSTGANADSAGVEPWNCLQLLATQAALLGGFPT